MAYSLWFVIIFYMAYLLLGTKFFFDSAIRFPFFKKICSSLPIILILFILISHNTVYAETVTDTPTPTSAPNNSQAVTDLQNKINDLVNKINDLQGQEKTLSSQIGVMDSQIKLTEYRIYATQQQLLSLEQDIDTTQKKVASLEDSLVDITKIMVKRIVSGYELGGQNGLQTLLTSTGIGDYFTRANYLRIVQRHDKRLAYDTVQAKNDYQNQQQIFEDKKKQVIALKAQLEQYTKDLDSQKKEKQQLLAETQGSEANYQAILAQTRAQLASFQGFVTRQGGASLLSGQTSCDDWGCYYNQRDSQWGGNALNGSGYTLASDGCLVTSMAMMYTHYGHRDVTPQSINSVSSNFGGIPAVLLKYSISANGVSSQRMSATIDSTLASGNPVVIGISYDGGNLPDHFLVLLSGSGGNYMMNDPFTPNGHNISFRGRYPTERIVEVDKVVF
jgi:peptidoglycan hydrolase CwlO-like protein